MHITQLKKFAALCAEASKAGLRLTESGAPRGERRWFHLADQSGKAIEESSDLHAIEKAIKNSQA